MSNDLENKINELFKEYKDNPEQLAREIAALQEIKQAQRNDDWDSSDSDSEQYKPNRFRLPEQLISYSVDKHKPMPEEDAAIIGKWITPSTNNKWGYPEDRFAAVELAMAILHSMIGVNHISDYYDDAAGEKTYEDLEDLRNAAASAVRNAKINPKNDDVEAALVAAHNDISDNFGYIKPFETFKEQIMHHNGFREFAARHVTAYTG